MELVPKKKNNYNITITKPISHKLQVTESYDLLMRP